MRIGRNGDVFEPPREIDFGRTEWVELILEGISPERLIPM
jgi:hypothetical protein